MKHKKLIIFLICIASVLVFYLIEFFNTNSLVNYVASVYYGKIPYELTKDTEYEGFDIIHREGNCAEIKKINLSIRRVFVIHNFKDGYMYVNIDCAMYDENNELVYCTRGPERWKIHKNNGKWDIVDIKDMESFIPLPKGFTNK